MSTILELHKAIISLFVYFEWLMLADDINRQLSPITIFLCFMKPCIRFSSVFCKIYFYCNKYTRGVHKKYFKMYTQRKFDKILMCGGMSKPKTCGENVIFTRN